MVTLRSHKLLFVAMMSVIVYSSSAMDCKEVWERKHETAECCSAPAFVNLDDVQVYIEAQEEGSSLDKFYCGVYNLFLDLYLLDGDGQLDFEAMKQNTEGFDEKWKQTSQQLIDHCAKKTKTAVANWLLQGNPIVRCRPMAGIFIMCMGKDRIRNCPADKWNSSELCEKVKSRDCDEKDHKH